MQDTAFSKHTLHPSRRQTGDIAVRRTASPGVIRALNAAGADASISITLQFPSTKEFFVTDDDDV